MMALTTYQLQGSCGTCPSVPSSWSRASKIKLISLRCRPCSSVGASPVLGPKSKLFEISAFKGKSRHDDSGGKANGSISLNNPVKISYLQHESENSSVNSSNAQPVVPATYALYDFPTTRSLAMQSIFKKWLILLRTSPRKNEVNEELSRHVESPETPKPLQKQEKSGIIKAVWCYFLGFDATITIPLLIFTPLYLGVNIMHGSEVSKELTPLWVLGPLIMALYVKIFRAICGLYVFTFKKTVYVVKNLPDYSFLVYEYLFRGKLKEAMRTYLWQPLVDIKNMDYNKLTRRKMTDFRGWLIERYLDYVESIWPYYNRMIRFLKRANLL